MHPLPHLLAVVERRLKPGDYLGLRSPPAGRELRIALWIMLVLGLLAPMLVGWALSGEPNVRFLMLVSFLAVEIPVGMTLLISPGYPAAFSVLD